MTRSRRLVLVAWCCLVLFPPAAGAQAVQRHLVVPFDNVSTEAQTYWLSEASAVILTDDLIALGAPAITRSRSTFATSTCRCRSWAFARPKPRAAGSPHCPRTSGRS